MQFYSDFAQSLRKAEVRQDSLPEQKEVSMSEYNSIAFNYEDQGDFLTASYFYQKVIELAITCKVPGCGCRTSSLNWWPCWDWASAMTSLGKRIRLSRFWRAGSTARVRWLTCNSRVR